MKNKYFTSILLILFLTVFSCKAMSTGDKNANGDPTSVIDPNLFIGLEKLQEKLHSIGNKEVSSVVSISTEKIISQSDNNFDPFDFFFKSPWDNEPQKKNPNKKEFKQGGLGSGVIYRKKGKIYYIVTNNHVVEGVDSIKVTVDQEKSYKGKILGTDPAIDIAVIKIETKDDLPIAKFGDSDKLKIGGFVIAIGNPFGLEGTMTFGIISALGRGDISVGNVNLTNFIQTDAAINPGNSGGPLINLEGEVIGINTLIYSRSGGNVGIGFSIPVNIARKIVDQIIDQGKVEHGYLGIEFEELTEENIKTLNLGNIKNGMHVLRVFENSPAEKHDIKSGDVLLELNGKKLKKSGDLTIVIGNSIPGDKVNLQILRNAKTFEKNVVLGNRDELEVAKVNNTEMFENYGMELAKLTKELREKFEITSNLNGVIIIKINPVGYASRVGLEEKDVIVKINNKSINKVEEVKNILEDAKSQNYFFINRKGKEFIVKM